MERKSGDLDQVRCIKDKEGRFWLQVRITERDGRTIFVSFSMID